jgi:hypothetical protein
MIKLDNNISKNEEANQLWKEFDRRLDATEDNLLNVMTEELLNKMTDHRYIQCLSYKGLAVIIGKIQVLQGQIEVLQGEKGMPQEKLGMLHAMLQVLCGKMFPYLAVRIKQADVSLQNKPIGTQQMEPPDAGPVDTVQEVSKDNAYETEPAKD